MQEVARTARTRADARASTRRVAPVGSPGTQSSPGPQGLLSSTAFLLGRVGSEARRRFALALAKRELRLHHYAILMALGELGVTSQQRLGAMIGVDPRNLVGPLDGLERRGLLRRAPDPSDRRRHAVTLTQAGQDLLRQLRRDRERVERDFLAALDRSEQAVLHGLLLRLLPARCGPTDDSDYSD